MNARPFGLPRFYCSEFLHPFCTPTRFQCWVGILTASWILTIALCVTWSASRVIAIPVVVAFAVIWLAAVWQSHSQPAKAGGGAA
jgi:endonuclease/exonuclease/phosphatase (EEP) superfamily protein YafD